MNESPPSPSGHLVVILSNPPTTSGVRTLARVALARTTLGFATASVVNLFSIATYRTGGIAVAGATPEGWFSARPAILEALHGADSVVLAYGCSEPSGPARFHFRGQLAWLHSELDARKLPVWMIDGRPRHPSRWHRHTFADRPTLSFAEALPLVLRSVAPAE